MKITVVAGARPNFIKIAPIIKAIQAFQNEGKNISFRLVHTGQHFDKAMSQSFFEQLGISDPDINLECGGGSQAEQTASIMIKFEKELLAHPPDVVLVVGDVTSTMACTITAKKLCIDVVHVEAGIRSGDITMPEEINRMVTDSITDHFFTTSEYANQMLQQSGFSSNRIHFVGNTMIDTLFQNLNRIIRPAFFESMGVIEKQYFILTLHRPSNVDQKDKLFSVLSAIADAVGDDEVIFPVHPRTRKILNELDLNFKKFHFIDPQSYLEFIYLIKNAKGIITDSGGITEEATVLNIPCLTMRDSTERPETVAIGTNELIGDDLHKLQQSIKSIKADTWKKGSIPEKWDGNTSHRVIEILFQLYNK